MAAAAAAATPAAHIYARDEESLYGLSGPTTAAQLAEVLTTHKYASYVCLLPTYTEEQCPVAAIEAAGMKFAHVPIEVPASLNTEKAMEVHAAFEALPKPIWVACATATRASAALLIHLAMKNKWTVPEAMDYGRRNGYKCVGVETVRNWVVASLLPPKAADVAGAQKGDVILRQLFDYATWTYTYIVACPVTREAIIIDPVYEKADRDVNLINELGLRLRYSINTHVHADHVSGSKQLKKRLGGVDSAISAVAKSETDVTFSDGDRLAFGTRYVTALATPGHTDACTSFVLDDNTMVFTGDALFVRGCGRTDFQQGSSTRLYDSIHTKIFTLPESCVVYPGHDYNGHERSTVGEEIRYNPRLNKTKDEFVAIMAGLKLAPPKLLDVSVPANLRDGEPVPVAAPAPAADAPAGGAGAATAAPAAK